MRAKRVIKQKGTGRIDELTPEEKKLAEWDRAMKWPEYFAMQAKVRKAEPNPEKVNTQAVNALHDFMVLDEWFAKNTPHPFKTVHWSYNELLADVACRYLQRLARQGNRRAIETLARLTVEMTETVTELLRGESVEAKDNAALMEGTARELPYWPVLYFKNTAANNQLPPILEKLDLGKECPINVSESAKYRLETPINGFVWRCLRHFQTVHWLIRIELETPGVDRGTGKAKTFEEAIEPLVFQRVESPPARRAGIYGMIDRAEIPIYQTSYKLPPLTKTTAKEWADKAIVPHVCSRYPDLSKVPEFANIARSKSNLHRKRLDGVIRAKLIQALQTLARKD